MLEWAGRLYSEGQPEENTRHLGTAPPRCTVAAICAQACWINPSFPEIEKL
jgi:hypothetical protein